MASLQVQIPIGAATPTLTTLTIDDSQPVAPQISKGRFPSEAEWQAYVTQLQASIDARATSVTDPDNPLGNLFPADILASLTDEQLQQNLASIDPAVVTQMQEEINRRANEGQPDFAATTTGVTPPTNEQLEFLENLRTQANAGGFARRDNVIDAVRSVMGLGNNVAGWAEAAALYERWIEPDLNEGVFTGNVTAGDGGGGGGGGGGGAPDVTPTTGPQSRADLFAAQTPATGLNRRLIANAFGTNLSPLAGRAAAQTATRFGAIDPFLEFENPRQTLGARFQGFAGGARPTGAELGVTLESLLAAAGDPNSAFRDVVPNFQTAASVGLQPGIANLNPRLRRRLSSRVLDEFATSMAQAPEQFQIESATNLAATIQDFRNRFQGF